jgi:hypothetical protein
MPIVCKGDHPFSASPLTPSIPDGGRLAFVTTNTFSTGGVSAADTFCQNDATSGTPAVHLASTRFRALLQTDTDPSPATRFNLDGGNWYRLDGLPLFKSADELAQMKAFRVPLSLKSNGQQFDGGSVPVWIGVSGQDCTNWSGNMSLTARIGRAEMMGPNSLFVGAQGCSVPAHLYCFEN